MAEQRNLDAEAEFTIGGTNMGATAEEGETHTKGMIGGGFGIVGRGDFQLCQIVVSSMGRPCARAIFAANGALLRWEQL